MTRRSKLKRERAEFARNFVQVPGSLLRAMGLAPPLAPGTVAFDIGLDPEWQERTAAITADQPMTRAEADKMLQLILETAGPTAAAVLRQAMANHPGGIPASIDALRGTESESTNSDNDQGDQGGLV